MKTRNTFLVRLSVLVICLLLLDGGRTFIHAAFNIHFNIEHRHDRDLEIPNHGNFKNLADDLKWIDTEFQQILLTCNFRENISFKEDFKTIDFPDSIWQPPKSS